jgi:hypothetical protein
MRTLANPTTDEVARPAVSALGSPPLNLVPESSSPKSAAERAAQTRRRATSRAAAEGNGG